MGRPIGWPGEEGGTFKWPGASQIYSSPHDMATFLAANLGELPDHRLIENAMALAQQPVFTVGPRLKLGLAWQNVSAGNFTIIDKNGGLSNTSTYIGFAPQRKLGIVILVNRGKQHAHRHRSANLARVGTRSIRALKRGRAEPGRRLIRSLKALLLYSYYYFTSSVAFFDVPDRLRDLAQ
jgi:CubicO group peptidase (beta-lactamase class C family)